MDGSVRPISPLYQRILILRRVLPVVALFLVFVHQLLEHTWLRWLPWPAHFLSQMLFYGAIGPALAWFTLTWIGRRVHERDEAETQLRSLYEVSRQAAAAVEMETLVEIALRMPEQVLLPLGTSLVVRDRSDAPWRLAGTHGLQPARRATLEAQLIASAQLRCGECRALAATVRERCPMLASFSTSSSEEAGAVICLPLSTERPPLALLNVYLPSMTGLAPASRQALESMAASLAVALDRARLREQELETLRRMDQVVRRRDGLAATLQQILADIATAHGAEVSAVFLTASGQDEPELLPVASWPEAGGSVALAQAGREVLRRGNIARRGGGLQGGRHIIAVPLVAEGLVVGAVVMAGRRPFTASQSTLLEVAAGMMALVIRRSQLYAELESQAVLAERSRLAREVHDGLAQSLGFLNFKIQQVDRLLARTPSQIRGARGEVEAARQALSELRAGVQEFYGEVRLMIQDLRLAAGEEQGLVERLRHYVNAFGARTGLDATFVVEGELELSPREEVQLFRIAQEALANVHKHARAQQVRVRLRATPDGTSLEVEDDGVGLPATPLDVPGHFGLRILQERVESLGGQLLLTGTSGRGTLLRVTIPDSSVLVQSEQR